MKQVTLEGWGKSPTRALIFSGENPIPIGESHPNKLWAREILKVKETIKTTVTVNAIG